MAGFADSLLDYLRGVQVPGANFGTTSPQEYVNQDPVTPMIAGANQMAKGAFEQSENLRTGGDYNAGPVLNAAVMGVAPSVAGVPEGALGVMGGRLGMPAREEMLLDQSQWAREGEAAAVQKQQSQQLGQDFLPDPDLHAQAEALRGKWTKFSDQYPDIGPPVLIDKTTGQEINFRSQTAAQKRVDAGDAYWSKQLTPEATEFQRDRAVIQRDMDVNGYQPFFDPAQRGHVDPSNYPAPIDMTTAQGGRANPMKEATLEKWQQTYDTPEARARMVEAYNAGTQIPGANDWYAMKQLEDSYVAHLGPEEGRKAFKSDFADSMAATTGGAAPTPNYLMSHYANFETAAGRRLPEASYKMPFPIGGRYAGTNIGMYQRWADEGAPGFGVANPKRADFSSAFTGNPNAFTTDEQMSGIVKPGMTEPTWYGPAAQVGHSVASDLGVVPRDVQDVAWAGEKKRKWDIEQAAKPPEKRQPFAYEGPMISHVNEAIERTSRLTGRSPAEVERLRVLKKAPMYGIAGGVAADALSELHDRGLISDEQFGRLNNGQR
jgi:hypothetical protein